MLNSNCALCAAILCGLLALSSAGALVYFWIVLGDRGLYADATGGDGYITAAESVLLGASLVGVILFPILFLCSLVFAIARRRAR